MRVMIRINVIVRVIMRVIMSVIVIHSVIVAVVEPMQPGRLARGSAWLCTVVLAKDLYARGRTVVSFFLFSISSSNGEGSSGRSSVSAGVFSGPFAPGRGASVPPQWRSFAHRHPLYLLLSFFV